jgi:hypothetical protein
MKFNRLKNQITKTNRINRVIDLLVRGTKRHDIVLLLSQEWNCSDIWVDKYIRKAKEVIREQFNNETIESMSAKYDFLYSEAINKGDRREARTIIDSKQKLLGIVSKIDITSGGKPINLKELFTFKDDRTEQ